METIRTRQLEEKIARLRAALKPFAHAADSIEQYRDDNAIGCGIRAVDLRTARAAMKE